MKSEVRFEAAAGAMIEPECLVGLLYEGWSKPAIIGRLCRIRTGSIIYADTALGASTVTGARVFIREHTFIGSMCLIGTQSIIEGNTIIGDRVVIQSQVYIPARTSIGDRVFLGPAVVLTNDRYPLRQRRGYQAEGPIIEQDASIGGNATILPGLRVGEGSMVAAGAVVTKDVPPWTLAVGVPARLRDLPENLKEPNVVRDRL